MDATTNNTDDIYADIPLNNISLPNQWVLYLYDKQLFKKIANKTNFYGKPHRELCTLSTVNDLMYILRLMEIKVEPKNKFDVTGNFNKTNLDVNNYIIMRKGIEPIWEDPKNCNGGTFTIKMDHAKGYDVWSLLVMYMLGETLTSEMQYINGITVSFIADTYNCGISTNRDNNNYTYIKIWDGKPNRTRDEFVSILPQEILEKIKSESLMYSQNNKKKDFNEKNIISKLNSIRRNYFSDKGGFSNYCHRKY
jgi:hypothetical protein